MVRAATRPEGFVRFLFPLVGGLVPWGRAELARYGELNRALYQGLAEACGGRLLVEGSKIPTRLRWLLRMPGLRVSVIHLVRDPRATAFSWMNPKYNPGRKRLMSRQSPWRASVAWLLRNTLVHLLSPWCRVVRLRYEDLVAAPQEEVQRVLHELRPGGPGPGAGPQGGRVQLGVSHTISGNPMRFSSGETVIRRDRRFEEQMPALQYWLTTVLTLPWVLYYGYPVRRRGGAAEPR
jgi:hypothetical protein